MAEGGFFSADGGMFAIWHEGRPVVRIERFASRWGRAATSSCWTITVGTNRPHRGNGIGSQAKALIVRYLFSHTRAKRVQAYIDVENVAERRALIKAGFDQEEFLRRAQREEQGGHQRHLAALERERDALRYLQQHRRWSRHGMWLRNQEMQAGVPCRGCGMPLADNLCTGCRSPAQRA
ncbi:GNAT family N-acetyltransferase [Microbacterium enclense]|uniref:GNAT family N-acetyltransferase n=1 Tax=Microbacterium enclense TaxID=993073 RepID=UPI003F7E5DB4